MSVCLSVCPCEGLCEKFQTIFSKPTATTTTTLTRTLTGKSLTICISLTGSSQSQLDTSTEFSQSMFTIDKFCAAYSLLTGYLRNEQNKKKKMLIIIYNDIYTCNNIPPAKHLTLPASNSCTITIWPVTWPNCSFVTQLPDSSDKYDIWSQVYSYTTYR